MKEKNVKRQNNENEVWKIKARTEIERRSPQLRSEKGEGVKDKEMEKCLDTVWRERRKDRDSQQQAVQAESGRTWNKGKERTNLYPF